MLWAAYKGHEEVVSLLLEKGADVHAHGNYNIKYVLICHVFVCKTI